ncbi:MAG: LysM peptidoglycan-binding domain-containing protein [Sporichthyaceae bacterium]
MAATAHLQLVPTPDRRDAPAHQILRRAAAPPVSRPVGLRLTRRGRLVALGVLVVAMLGLGMTLGSEPSRASGAAGAPVQYHLVQPGQTLWGIAQQAAPGTDPRAVIEEIISLNGLRGTTLQAGARIALP